MPLGKALIRKLNSLLENFGRKIKGEIHVHEIAEVQSYDSDNEEVTVQPVANKKFNDGEYVQFPPVSQVPVAHYQSGEYAILMPVKPGDFVTLHVVSRSTDEWADRGAVGYDPQMYRRVNMHDSIAFLGARPRPESHSEAHEENLRITNEDGSQQIEMEPGGNITIKAESADVVCETPNSVRFGDENSSVPLALAPDVKAELSALWTAIRAHTHPVQQPLHVAGVSSTSPSPYPGVAGNVDATHAKDE